MALPVTPLPLITELLIGGTWTDVSGDVRVASGGGVSITRGRADESTHTTASKSKLTLDNRTGVYSNRNPMSPYYGLLGRNTQMRNRIRWVADTFTRTVSPTVTDTFARTVASGWGTATTGQVWSNSGGSASDYNVGSGVGTMSAGVVNSSRFTVLAGLSLADVDVRAEVAVPVVATGASISSGLRLRAADTSNYYYVEVDRRIDGTIRLQLVSRVAAVSTTIAGPLSKGAYLAGETWTVRGRVVGSVLQGKLWKTSQAEPEGWDLEVVTTSLPSAGPVGTRVILSSGNTNSLPVVATWDNLTVTAVTTGWGTTTSGHTWTSSGGSASESTIYDGAGMISLTTVDASRRQVIAAERTDSDLTVTVRIPVVAATDSIDLGLMSRYAGSGDYYLATLHFHDDATYDVRIRKQITGVFTTLAISDIVDSYAAGDRITLRFATSGGALKAMAWPAGTTPPATWQATVYDTDITAAGDVGIRANLQAANTNSLPVSPSYDDFEVNDYRFWGECAAFAPQWDVSGRDVTVPVDAAGILQRIGQSRRPERSPLYRTMIGIAPGDYLPFEYWPMEDSSDATQIASALPDGSPITLDGEVSLAAESTLASSAPLVTLGSGATVTASVRPYADTGRWWQQIAVRVPAEPVSETTFLEIRTSSSTRAVYRFTIAPGSPATANLYELTSAGAVTATHTINLDGATGSPTEADIMGNWMLLTVGSQNDFPSAGSLSTWFYMAGLHVDLSWGVTGSNVGGASGGTITGFTTYAGNGASFGHGSVYVDPNFTFTDVLQNVHGFLGWAGETAAERLERLCREEGIPFELIGDAADTKLMGPQQIATKLDLLFACADVDQGILHEPRDSLAVAYRTSASLYNQSGPEFGYETVIAPPLLPVEDDQLVVNDVTVQRIGGSSARYEVTEGPLSTQDPPDGVGTYDAAPDINLYTDDQCYPLASAIATRGTWDEARYPVVAVNLASDHVSGDEAIFDSVVALDVGDYFTITDPPEWLPPADIDLLVQGSSEFLSVYDWALSWNCTPAGPYMTGVYDEARYDTDATTTAEALDTTETAVDITIEDGSAPWITTADNPAEFPVGGVPILIGGEEMAVTASVSTGALTYTLTVSRSANGVVKEHEAGTPVHVRNPGRYTYS